MTDKIKIKKNRETGLWVIDFGDGYRTEVLCWEFAMRWAIRLADALRRDMRGLTKSGRAT